jgi:hypothetical protein
MRTLDVAGYIFDSLPAKSYAEILERVNAVLTVGIDKGQLAMAILAIRRNPAKYGFTIPHCRRGREQNDDRLFAVLVNAAGQPQLEIEQERHFERGARGTFSHVVSMFQNASAVFKLVKPRLRTMRMQRYARELLRDMIYISEKVEVMGEVVEAMQRNTDRAA